MKKTILYFLFIILLAGCSISERLVYLSPPSKIEADTLSIKDYEVKYGEYDGVYLNYQRALEHSGTNSSMMNINDWKYHKIVKRKYMILNPDNSKLTTFTLSVPEKAIIDTAYMRVITPEKEIRDYYISDCRFEEESNDYKTYKFIYPDVKKGTIIEEGFAITYDAFNIRPPIDHDIRLQFNIPCENLELIYAYPDWWEIKIKKIQADKDLLYTIQNDEEKHKKVLTYTAKNIPAVKWESFSPFFKEMSDYLQLMVTKLDMTSYYYNAPDNWVEFGKKYESYAMHKHAFLSNRVSKTTKEIIKDCTTPKEKLEQIIFYLQNNVEIQDDHKERNFSKILKEGKGDPFRITGLALAMLKDATVEAEFLLVHNAKNGYFDPEYYSSDQFSLPAVGVIIDGDKYFAFPYLKYLDINYTPEFLQGSQALVIEETMLKNKYEIPNTAEFWILPSESKIPNYVTENYDLQIDDEGLIVIQEEKILNCSAAYYVRKAIDKLNEDEKEKFIDEILTYNDGEISDLSFEILSLEEYKEPLRIILNYRIDNLVTVTPDEVIFQTGGLLSPVSMKKHKIAKEERKNPIRIYYDQTYNKNINIHYPATWELETALPEINYENDLGSVQGEYTVSANNIQINQSCLLKKSSKPKEKITELVEISGENAKINIPILIFTVRKE
jgi:hypothetical protein